MVAYRNSSVELYLHLEWKPFRKALDKSERKQFDDMFDIPRVYIRACSNSISLVPLDPIMISILFIITNSQSNSWQRLSR
jgi:hypothetical protein